ncbi:MAG TPA: hypothetical protein VHK24_15060, partial [Steroidobacter sp.]|nr:hypothetical protein [Steroidobacter sp.]
VLEIDHQRKRIALTMRLEDSAPRARDAGAPGRGDQRGQKSVRRELEPQAAGAMAEALARAFKRT